MRTNEVLVEIDKQERLAPMKETHLEEVELTQHQKCLMRSDDMSDPEADGQVQILDFKNKRVSQANRDCQRAGLVLRIVEDPADREVTEGDEERLIRQNAESSLAGTWSDVGGTVGVILYPLEPRQTS